MPDRTNGKWKDPVRLPIIEDRQGHVRRSPSERDHILFRHSPTAVRRNGKDHPKHHASPRTTLTGSHRPIHGRQTSPTDRVGRFDAPSRTELLYTQEGHHRRLSVVFITQNIFPRGTKSRTIALNTTYLVMMKNVRDVSKVATLGRQLFPGRSKILTSASVRIPGLGHVTSLGRHLHTENTRVPGSRPDSVRSQTFIRGRTRD